MTEQECVELGIRINELYYAYAPLKEIDILSPMWSKMVQLYDKINELIVVRNGNCL